MQNTENSVGSPLPKKRKVWKVIRLILLSFILFILGLLLILRLSTVQTFIASKFSNYLSEKTQTEISIGRLDISGLLHVKIFDLHVVDQEDTLMIDSKIIDIDINLPSLWNNKLHINSLIIDSTYFALMEDSRDQELSLMKLVNYFTSSDTTKSESNFEVYVDLLDIRNSQYRMDLWSTINFDDGGMNYTHLDIDSVNLIITDFTVEGDTLVGNMDRLTAHDKCGFILDDFIGQIRLSSKGIKIENFHVRTGSSWAYMPDYQMIYKQWLDWIEFNEKVKFRAQVDSANLNLDDLKYFATSLTGMLDTLRINGNIRGPIAKLKLRSSNISFKEKSHFIGDITVSGLPDVKQTFMLVKANEIRLNKKEASQFYLPNKKRVVLPELLSRLGNIIVTGRFTGFYNDFVSNAKFKTDLGTVTTDVLLQPYHQGTNKLEYHGKLTTTHFQIGGLLGQEVYGGITMTAIVDGIGLLKDADATYNIDIASLYLSENEYKDVKIEGSIKDERIDAQLSSIDGAFKLDANGSYNYHDTLPAYNMDMVTHNARISRLFLLDTDTFGKISGKIKLDLKGNSYDNLTGSVTIDSLSYATKDKSYFTNTLELTTSRDANSERKIDFDSEWLDADISGQFNFIELKMLYQEIFKDIFPSLLASFGVVEENLNEQKEHLTNDYIEYDFRLKNTADIFDIFLPSMRTADGTNLAGFYNVDSDSLVLNLASPKISYADHYAENLNLKIIKPPKTLHLSLSSSLIKTLSFIEFDNLNIQSEVTNDTIDYKIKWGKSQSFANKGDFSGEVTFLGNQIDARFSYGSFWFNDTLWELSEKSHISYAYHELEINDFSIYSIDNHFNINGKLSESPSDFMNFDFYNFNLSLFDFYLQERFLTNLDGYLSGKFDLSNPWTTVGFTSEFQIEGFALNNSFLGNAYINSMYSRSRDAFVIDMTLENRNDSIPIKYLDLGGFYYPNRASNNLELDLYFNQYPLESLGAYLSSFTSDIKGIIDGKLKIGGSLDEPLVLGKLDADVSQLRIDYIGTDYHLKDKLVFREDYFGFDDIYIYDKEYSGGNSHRALSNIQIKHNNYHDFSLFIDVKPENLKALNLKSVDNKLFYGKAYGSGHFKLSGPFNELTMNMDVKSEDKSHISIPISTEEVAEKADFITFIYPNDTLKSIKLTQSIEDDFSIDMDMSVSLNPLTQLEIVMDEVVGDIITARGNGKIRMVYNDNSDLSMYGKYEIERGDYLFTMQNIINKHFTIDPGSKIIWNGDFEQAKIEMRAIYKTDAKLYDLIQQVEQSEEFKKRASRVYCIINISGTLYSPSISFDIDLPEESMATQELVKQLLTLSDGNDGSSELNKNFVSLLVLGRFLPPSGYDSGANPDAISKNATEMVANQLGNILNKLSDEVEIGLDWNPGDEVTTQEVAVALSYSILNDRMVIDGRFGTGGGSTSPESAQRIVGDINVEYKFTKDGRIRGRVFNRTNYYDPLTYKAPYTQGVGIVYRKEFDNLYELFHRTKAEQEEVDKNEASAEKRKESKKRRKEEKQKKREQKKSLRKQNKEFTEPSKEVKAKDPEGELYNFR